MRFAQEGGQALARLLAREPVQIELALDRPLAAPQPHRHVGTDAGAAKAQTIVGEQQRLDVDLIGQRLAHRLALVAFALVRMRFRPRARHLGAPVVAQALHGAHGFGEHIACLLLAQRLLRALRRQRGLGLLLALHPLAQRLQLLEPTHFHRAPVALRALLERAPPERPRAAHNNPRSANDTTSPRPTTR